VRVSMPVGVARVGRERRWVNGLAEHPAVGVSICAYAVVACRRQVPKLRAESPGRIEQLFRLVAAQPAFHELQVLRIRTRLSYGYLMSAPEILDLVAVDLLGTRPSFR